MDESTQTSTEAAIAQTATDPNAADDPAKPATAVETPKETASALLARLAKQKKEQLTLAKKLSATDSEKSELQKRIQELESKTKKPENPIDALRAAGFSYEDATNQILNDGKMTAEQKLKALQEHVDGRFKELETREEERKRLETEAAQREQQAQIDAFKDEISGFIDENKDKYEYTHLYGGQELVYQVIAQHYLEQLKTWEESGREGKSPKMLSKAEAADLVEKDFEERFEKGTQTKKYQSKITPKTDDQPKPFGAPAPQTRTLSNAATASSTPAGRISDPIARGIAALERMGR